MARFVARRRVEFAHTDMAGVVHFAQYFRYMESVEHEFFRSVGRSVHEQGAEGCLSWPRGECSCRFHRPLRFEDEFEVRLGVERIGRSTVRFRADIWKEDRCHATGWYTTICCRLDGGAMTAVRVPDALRRDLESIRIEADAEADGKETEAS